MGVERYTDEVAGVTLASWAVPGGDPPVVCVHGAGVSSRQTMPLVEELDGRIAAWAVDMPGFGRSTSAGRLWTVPEMADVLLEWTRARGLTRPCLLGASLGTQVVAEAAARAPEEVGSVVLVGPTTDPRMRSMPVLTVRLLWDIMREPISLLPGTVLDYRAAGSRRVFHVWAESRDHRIEQVLPRVPQPALVVWGTKDRVCTRPWVEEATRLLPRGRLVAVPGQPHALTADSPGSLAGVIEDFVEGVAP